jgi:hypothetical protein
MNTGGLNVITGAKFLRRNAKQFLTQMSWNCFLLTVTRELRSRLWFVASAGCLPTATVAIRHRFN